MGLAVALGGTGIWAFMRSEAAREMIGDIETRPERVCDPVHVDFNKFAAVLAEPNMFGGLILHVNVAGDAPRHPASLTKVMTLAVAFDALDAGVLKLDDTITFSAAAASAPRSNLGQHGVKAGDILSVREVMLGVGVWSGNDAAKALAEKIAGTEAKFVTMMNTKARALGMYGTVYKNASGLPDKAQVTTARDMIHLLHYVDMRYAAYRKFLSAKSFGLHLADGQEPVVVKSRNKLLRRKLDSHWVMDMAKTGYINASGANMVFRLSESNSGNKLYGAVFGGQGGKGRDACIRNLVSNYAP